MRLAVSLLALAVVATPVHTAKPARPPQPPGQGLPLRPARTLSISTHAGSWISLGMGAHGEVPGIGFHREMQAHALGGMAPMAVLHAATAGSAETIGRLHDLGTLEPGKFADLVILDKDPRSDIRNTQAISAVMRGGFLYDGADLAQLWPRALPRNQSPGERASK